MPRHAFDVLSFIAGALLLGLGIATYRAPLRLTAVELDLLLPIAAVVVGVGILLTLRPRPDVEDPAVPADAVEDPSVDDPGVPLQGTDVGDDRL